MIRRALLRLVRTGAVAGASVLLAITLSVPAQAIAGQVSWEDSDGNRHGVANEIGCYPVPRVTEVFNNTDKTVGFYADSNCDSAEFGAVASYSGGSPDVGNIAPGKRADWIALY